MRFRDDEHAPATPVEILRDDGDAGQSGVDVIESPPGTRAPGWIRTPVVIVLLAMVIGGVAGYLVGHHRAGTDSPSVESVSTGAPETTSLPVSATGNRCAVQEGTHLQLGVELLNRSTTPVILRPARVVLPLNGLRIRSVTWGGCGQLVPAAGGADRMLP